MTTMRLGTTIGPAGASPELSPSAGTRLPRPGSVLGPRRLALLLLALAVVAAGTTASSAVASPQPPRAPTIGAMSLRTPLTSGPAVVLESEPAGSVLRGDPNLKVQAVGLSEPIASYEFQYLKTEPPAEPPEPGGWRTIEKTANPATTFETGPRKDGLYDLRVIATTAAGTVYESELPDRLIANESPVMTLTDPGTNLRGTITLKAKVPKEPSFGEIGSVSFELAPAGSSTWTTIEPGNIQVSTNTSVSVSFNTTTVPDGEYDFRVVPKSATSRTTFVSIPARKRLIDNTPPTVEMTAPTAQGPPLSGSVTLSAHASDSGSGVASVRFQERSAAGVSAWRTISETSAPSQPGVYTHTLNTKSLQNGSYDFRALASDVAGNEAISPAVDGIEVDNMSLAAPFSASVIGIVPPAEQIGFLGAVEGSPQHEAWAYGFTSGPPAEVEGHRLPYTALGEQLVLLRYTDEGGWQIAEVLREPDGSPFPLLPADTVSSESEGRHLEDQVHVAGAMTPSGEAWLWVAEASTETGRPPVVGLFHRVPGHPFGFDREATETLKPLLGSSAQDPGSMGVDIRLGESGQQAYGMLTAPGQAEQPGGSGQRLEYGVLEQGKWTLETAAAPPGLGSNQAITLKLGDVNGAGAGWGAFEDSDSGTGLILGQFHERDEWTYAATDLDALDLTGTVANPKGSVEPTALKAEGSAVWVEANVALPPREGARVVARYDGATSQVTNSWCTLAVANHCQEPLDPDHPAAVPEAVFKGEDGEPEAVALSENFVDVFAHGQWTSVAAPGYGHFPSHPGEDMFSGPNEGWLAGTAALGHWSTEGASSQLASWPLPDRSTLTSVALPTGSDGEVGESGALAVGLDGTTLSYEASVGWQVQPVPLRARGIPLLAVAFAGPSSAFAVGQSGVILHWDGSAWSEDPQSTSLTVSQLNAVAFGASGEGWAVGANGTILHYNGQSWSSEQPPEEDKQASLTSVTVAGTEVFAIAGGNLITRSSNGRWQPVSSSRLPNSPAPVRGSLGLVAGLPDGGVVAAGRSVMLVREGDRGSFDYAAQPLGGTAVALAPFRESDGKLRAYVSVAPAADAVTGFPAGDGELLRQTAVGWQDLSRAQYPGDEVTGDGALKSDPVLAVATGPSGEHAWAVGGYDGTPDAAEQGTEEALASRPVGWQTASIWRYDTAGSAESPLQTQTTSSPPSEPGEVSFAFFTSPMCREECSAVQDAQPDVNLTAAAKEISSYKPAFAMLGGNAVGPLEGTAWQKGDGAADFAHLPEVLSPLSVAVPTFAALGKFDYVPGRPNETQPWAEAFAGAHPPFGSGPAAPGIAPVSSGAPIGEVNRYYAFNATQNEGTLRVIVLDNALGSLEKSAQGQRPWLEQQLASAAGAALPVVVIAAHPLRYLNNNHTGEDGEEVAALLASSGVIAVFTTNGTSGPGTAAELHELDQLHMVPEQVAPGAPQIPEYEGASLGYQQTENNGVIWYYASVNTQAREVQVSAIPVIDSLSLKPLDGLIAERSQTLQFEAIGRRAAGTLASKANESRPFEGYDNYVEIPAPPCSHGAPCVQPTYAFTSSEPTIGNFVVPSAPGSPYPKLNASEHPIPSSTSGLFCAYNSGTTIISVTTGLFSASLPVTVEAGGHGPPCGTVKMEGVEETIKVRATTGHGPIKTAAAPAAPPAAPLSSISPALSIVPPPPALATPPVPAAKPAPTPAPSPPPAPEPPATPTEQLGPAAAILPAATPPVEPIPPGAGGYAQSPAKREEKARKHASQSAFSLRPSTFMSRPAGAGGEDWFYGAVGIAALLALFLSARGLPAGPRSRPVLLREDTREGRRRR